MLNDESVAIIGSSMLFRRLSADHLEQVCARAVVVNLDDGDMLFNQRDSARRFYLVQSGQIKLFQMSADGTENVIEILGAGSTFAEALMFLEKPLYPVSAQAMKPTAVISIDAKHFVSILRQSADSLLLIAADLSQRLHGLVRELNDLSLMSGTCRVANYLIKNLEDDEDSLTLDIPKQTLASRLSVKPETLSRIFRRLTEAGVVAIDGNIVTVLDSDRLMDLADPYAVGVA